MGDPSTQQAQRNAVHKAWLAHLGEHTLLVTGSEWLTKEMWKLQQHAWLHSYSAGNIIQMPRVLNSSQYLEEWEEPELTGQVISKLKKKSYFYNLEVLCLFAVVVIILFACFDKHCLLNKNTEGQLPKYKKFCHSVLPRTHLTSLSRSVAISLQLLKSFGGLG